MPLAIWSRLTDLGDSSFLLPAALLLAIFVWRGADGGRRATHWLLIFGACGASVLTSKVAYQAWGLGIQSIDFRGFSGHTALAAVLFPVTGISAFDGRRRGAEIGGAALGLVLAVLVAVSRVAVGAHSVSETASGLALGLLAGAWYLQGRASTVSVPSREFRGARLMFGMTAVFAYSALIGRAPTYEWTVMLAGGIRGLAP